jgi:hypothetical protein
MQDERLAVDHRGKKYFLKRIELKDFITLKNFCEKEIDTINLMAIDNAEQLDAASVKWQEFMNSCFENVDEALGLQQLTGKEMGELKANFFLVYQGIDPKAFNDALKRLRGSENATA